MKKIFLLIVFASCLFFLDGQEVFTGVKPATELEKTPVYFIQKEKCSPYSKMLLGDYTQLTERGVRDMYQVLGEKYSLDNKSGQLFVGAFFKYKSTFDAGSWQEKGVFVKMYKNGIGTARVPLDQLNAWIDDPAIEYVQIAEPIHEKLDAAKVDVGIDLIHSGTQLPQPFKGNGVVVGVMDSGFDLTHPNWYSEDQQSYRVVSMWDQNTSIGNPPAGYNYGTHIEGVNDLLNWENDNINQNGMWLSQGSHGTHVAGIAAGSGVGTGQAYTGVAPASPIVLVSYNGTDQGFADGVSYVYQVAQVLGMPCVINMSLGKHLGPHDGLSFFDQFVDQLSAPGRIAVGAAGNEGDTKLHVRKEFTGSDSLMYTFVQFKNSQIGTDGSGVFDIWGDVGEEYRVAVNLYDINQQGFVDWTEYISTSNEGLWEWELMDFDGDITYVAIAAQRSNPLNGKGNITVEVNNTSVNDGDIYVMLEVISNQGTVDIWTDDAEFTDLDFNPPVKDGDVQFTVGEIGGTGKSVVSVGAYTTKNGYVNLNGNNMGIDFPAPNGEIASFSSIGPSADGRLKPEITAPGNVVVSSFSSFDPNLPGNHPLVVDAVTDGNQNWFFGAFQGTSMSSPVVTGAIALWLQANPELTHDDVLDILASTAREDSFTGNINANGSILWGYGKLDAYAGLQAALGLSGIEDLEDISATLDVVPNPASGEVTLGAALKEDAFYTLHSLTGQPVLTGQIPKFGHYSMERFDVSEVPEGMYILTLHNNVEFGQYKLVVSR